MKLKPTRLFGTKQLLNVVVSKSRNSNYSRILPVVVKKIGLSVILLLTIPTLSVSAQVTPDESLSTDVEQQGENEVNINGGEREGNNLFHSFEEFSIPEGLEAVFENATDIENIFTRITGESASAINGILRTQGGANFFLVNPNGIVFGENVQLDVGGSFIATTANSVQFEDGTEFIASDAQEESILTVSVPIGLQFDGNNGAITVNGAGNQITSFTPTSPTSIEDNINGLEIKSGKTLGLIGSSVNVDGGKIVTENGLIELGSISFGTVNFQPTESGLTFDYDAVSKYRDISLTNLSLINASGEGIIKTTGANVSLENGSLFLIQNQSDVASGNLTINAFESLVMKGNSSDGSVASTIQTEALSSQKGANITISSPSLVLRDANIRAITYGNGSAGDIVINADNSVQLLDNSTPASFNAINASTYSSGDAGNITISAPELSIIEGSSITSSTLGTGEGGNITIDASSIKVNGIKELAGITIPTQSNIITSAVDAGSAGNITLNTLLLKVTNGGAINSSSLATGDAGTININALESVEVSGRDITGTFSSTIETSIVNDPIRQQIFGISSTPSGNAGNLNIETLALNINQGGLLSVENEGSGNAGTLSIDAEDINLDNAGSISATSASGTGGNVNLDTNNLQIDEGSQITAEAGNNGDGGNITINTTSLIAKKNSQVTANAFNGRGGNLEINAEGLFLFHSPSNIFSASSKLGIDGTIKINAPDLDLQKELEQSELKILTTEEAISSSCLARGKRQGSFTVNNSPGFPKSPDSNYSDLDTTLTGMSSLPATVKQPEAIDSNNQQPKPSMLPAQRMVETPDGRIFLVAAPQEPRSLVCPQN